MQNQPLNQENPDQHAPVISEAPSQSTTTEATTAEVTAPQIVEALPQTTEAPQTSEVAKPADATQATLPETEPTVETKERKQAAINMLEAALYVAGRPLDLNEMGQVLGSRSKKRVIGYAETLA